MGVGGGGGRLESQGERQLIRLGDDSPMLGIYSIRREGGMGGRRSAGANGLGGGWDSIIAPPTQGGCWRERQRPQR